MNRRIQRFGREEKTANLLPCGALDWNKRLGDYELCGVLGQRCRIEGLLLSVEVPLCESHIERFNRGCQMVTPLWESEEVLVEEIRAGHDADS